MSKTIEEIKEEVSREFLHPYRTWLENSRFSNDDNISVLEDSGAIDEVVKRYAQSQTQDLIELLEHCKSVIHAYNDYRPTATGNEILQAIQDRLTKYNHLNKK